jgi:hypothetical protein
VNAFFRVVASSRFINITPFYAIKSRAIPITDRGGLYGFETSRIPHVLDNRLTGDGEGVKHTRRPPFTPQEDCWYSFLLESESTPEPLVRLIALCKLKKLQ